MKLLDAMERLSQFGPLAVPELRYIETAARKVHERWPDITNDTGSREREALALEISDRVARHDWSGARISFVLAAAGAVFDEERRNRADLEDARSFLFSEITASSSNAFLAGMLAVYLKSFEAGSAHTRALAERFSAARDRMTGSLKKVVNELPELLDPVDGPRQLAVRMARMNSPFRNLIQSGLRNPHGTGFMDRTHEILSIAIQPDLISKERIDWFLNWLRPPGREARTSGAERAIEALTHPWLNKAPAETLRSHLVEALVEMFGDPRIRPGGVWSGVALLNMQVIHRWLTREDMRFFTGVIDATQEDAMWPPRRDFWLKLYDEGIIDAAWVAFSAQAMAYAREHLMRQDARNANERFGYQQARQNTSLLIMKIGNKIVVDGCHSYRTHVFNETDKMAPILFREGYDCDEIMRRAPASKAHQSIPDWSRWVRDTLNSDVPFSSNKSPYRKVYRPRA